jgi:hypothetical protein
VAYPVKSNWRKGWLNQITSSWLMWFSNFANTTIWRGLKFEPTSSGQKCKITIDVDGQTLELTATNFVLQVKDDGIDTQHIADAAVDTAQIADSAVETAKINNSAVTAAKIASGAVGSTQIANSAVGTNQLANAAVTTIKIGNSAVGTNQLASGAVTNAKTTGFSGSSTYLNFTITNGLVMSAS